MDDVDNYMEGSMTVSPQSSRKVGEPPLNTLDEPIKETFMRDVKAVGVKFLYVLFPREKKTLLKEWDLWGPLVLCTFMAMILQGSDSSADGDPEFAQVFVLMCFGSLIVTLNTKLLGGNISFFQSVCVLGYCLLPTAIALIFCKIILLRNQSNFLFFLRLVISMGGFAWATYASTVFLKNSQKSKRKYLAVYPICLFYFIITWLVISHTNT